MFMCGQKQNKNTNRSQSLSQMSILVTLGYNDSHWNQQCPKGELCSGTALRHCISFWRPYPISPTVCEADRASISCRLCPLTKSKMAAITGTQWRGKKSDSQKFSAASSEPKVVLMPPLFLASFSLLMMDLSSQVFPENLANIRPFFFFGYNNDVLQLPTHHGAP